MRQFKHTRFKEEAVKKMDQVEFLLSSKWKNKHIGELYRVLGKENFIKFLDIFAGITLTIPKKRDIERLLRDYAVYYDYRYNNISTEDISTLYGLPIPTVYNILERMRDLIRKLDIEKLEGVKNE